MSSTHGPAHSFLLSTTRTFQRHRPHPALRTQGQSLSGHVERIQTDSPRSRRSDKQPSSSQQLVLPPSQDIEILKLDLFFMNTHSDLILSISFSNLLSMNFK